MKHDLSSSQSSPQVGAGGSQATQLDGGLLNPPRLLGDGTLLEQRLLHSASWDAAPSGARARMEAALAPVLIDPPASAVRSPEVSAPERTAPAGSSKAT